MKPGEDWRYLPDAAERRKIQNRIAQRAYRRNMRARKNEIEQLKQQLHKVQEAQADPASNTTRPKQHTRNTLSRNDTTKANKHILAWCPAPEEEQPRDGNSSTRFDIPPVSPTSLGTDNFVPTSPCTSGSRTPPGLTPSMSSPASQPRRNIPINTQQHNGRDDVHVPLMSLYTNPEELSLAHENPSFSLESSMKPTATHMTPTELDLGSPSPWPALDGKPLQRIQSASSTSGFLSNLGAAEVPPTPLLRPTESLLHLSIAGGHPEILKLLLQDVEIFIDEKDSAGYTPLQRAVMSGRADMVAILLEHGADVNGSDNCRSKPEGNLLNVDAC